MTNITDLWIPIKLKAPDEDKFDEVFEENNHDIECVFDCKLPEDGEKVLVSGKNEEVYLTYFYRDYFRGYFLNFHSNLINAWMPSPPAYQSEDK